MHTGALTRPLGMEIYSDSNNTLKQGIFTKPATVEELHAKETVGLVG